MKKNLNTSNWTGRTPRSLTDAFGPYATYRANAPRPAWRDVLPWLPGLVLAAALIGLCLIF